MSFLKKYIPFVLAICLCLDMVSIYAFGGEIPIPMEEVNDRTGWYEMGQKGSLAFQEFLSSGWQEASNNPRLVGAVMSTACLFVLSHKVGPTISKNLGADKCDKAINQKYLSAKKIISSTIAPVSSYIPHIPGVNFVVGIPVGIVKHLFGAVEEYFLYSKKYMLGSFATGGGFYICGHPVVAGWIAALILVKGWISQDLEALKKGHEEIKDEIGKTREELGQEIRNQGDQVKKQILDTEKKLSDQAAKNIEELKKEMQGISGQMDGLQSEMKQQIVASACQTEGKLQQVETHIEGKIDIMSESMAGKISKVDEKMVELLGKIDSVAEEAARKELIRQLEDLNKKSEVLKAEFCEAMRRLAEQGKLTQDKVSELQKQLAGLKQQLAEQKEIDSSIIGEVHQKANAILDKQEASDQMLREMKDEQLQIKIGIAQQKEVFASLSLSHQELSLIASKIKNDQENFSTNFARIASQFEDSKKASDESMSKFFDIITGEISGVKKDVSGMKEDVNALKEENNGLKATMEGLIEQFSKYQEERKRHDQEQEKKRKKDKKKLSDLISSGQQKTNNKIDSLGHNLATVATGFGQRLDAIASAAQSLSGQQQLISQEQKERKNSFMTLGLF